ncbi:MAG: carboxymuconolactone decarboxylase family protein [Solirubrobacteraceae bacterium]
MPIAPMPREDFTAPMRFVAGETPSETTLAFTGLIGKAGSLGDSFLDYYATLTKQANVLGWKLTELLRLAVATTTGCEACLAFRNPKAIAQGMDADAPDLFDELETADFTDRERAAIRYTIAFSTNHHLIDDAMWDALKSLFDDEELMTMCLYVATFLGTSRLSHAVRLIDGHCTVPGYRLAAITDAKAAQGPS